jgi:hypothetical protein
MFSATARSTALLTVLLPEPMCHIDAGFNHSIAISKEGGRLYVWGKLLSLVCTSTSCLLEVLINVLRCNAHL